MGPTIIAEIRTVNRTIQIYQTANFMGMRYRLFRKHIWKVLYEIDVKEFNLQTKAKWTSYMGAQVAGDLHPWVEGEELDK